MRGKGVFRCKKQELIKIDKIIPLRGMKNDSYSCWSCPACRSQPAGNPFAENGTHKKETPLSFFLSGPENKKDRCGY
jgi:hypothetical protein